MSSIKIIILILVANQVIARPIEFATLNKLIYNNQAEQELQQLEEPYFQSPQQDTIQVPQVQQDSTQTSHAQHNPTQSSNNQPKSMFEEYPWLDNALALLSDKFIRLLGFLIKKFILKMDVNMAEIF